MRLHVIDALDQVFLALHRDGARGGDGAGRLLPRLCGEERVPSIGQFDDAANGARGIAADQKGRARALHRTGLNAVAISDIAVAFIFEFLFGQREVHRLQIIVHDLVALVEIDAKRTIFALQIARAEAERQLKEAELQRMAEERKALELEKLLQDCNKNYYLHHKQHFYYHLHQNLLCLLDLINSGNF